MKFKKELRSIDLYQAKKFLDRADPRSLLQKTFKTNANTNIAVTATV